MKHLILTPYNVGLWGYLKSEQKASLWMEYRKEIFEKYCYPSVMNQTNKDFVWIVFYDKKTPDNYKGYKNVKDVIVSDNMFRAAAKRIIQKYTKRGEVLITMRLDNDDAIHKEFVKRVQEIARKSPPPNRKGLAGAVGINFTKGYCYNHNTKKKTLMTNQSCSTFLSNASYNSDTHAWVDNGPSKLRTIQCGDRPMWIRIIHDKNLSNKMKGVPTDAKIEGFF